MNPVTPQTLLERRRVGQHVILSFHHVLSSQTLLRRRSWQDGRPIFVVSAQMWWNSRWDPLFRGSAGHDNLMKRSDLKEIVNDSVATASVAADV
ncbi:hypothetical protein Y032_0171g297 [Ancylostoma ceylanicum]|uniref:Uncharacterized protein n=1 Tax=Ancylostoma ceylanicum TaxID=53326 RepID=A0A016SVB7_9BILA|nr:hypothetical protein Y032_0171g297 [Ancylostoma ceylanicum]